jgi:beta-phosphoglucomutase-like phosphatase (HAD superfamily)
MPCNLPSQEPIIICAVLLCCGGQRLSDGQARLPGLDGLVAHLFAVGTSCILISNAGRRDVVRMLDMHGCAGRLPMRICGEDMPSLLPDPSSLALAARRLALPAWRCLVIADGADGVQAGRLAGCATIGLSGMAEAEVLSNAGAQCVISRLDAILPLARWFDRQFAFGEAPRAGLRQAKAAG